MWSLRQLGGVLKRRVAIFALAVLVFQVAPVYALPRPEGQVVAEELPTVDEVREQLEARVEDLKDIQAVLSLKQYDPQSQALVNEAEMELQAVAPSVMRLTYRKPDILRGNVYVLDYSADEVYQYYPLFDLAECSRLDAFLEDSPLMPSIEGIFAIPNGDNLGQIEVIGFDAIDGNEYVVLRAAPSELVIEEGLDDVIEGTLESAMGLSVEVQATDTMYIWVDLEHELIRQMKVVSAEGELLVLVEMTGLQVDQGLSASTLKSFRGAEIRRCR